MGDGYSLFNWLVTFINATAAVLQLYVGHLVVNASPESMRKYRPCIALISFWDFIFVVMMLLQAPRLLNPASCMVANGLAGLAGRDFSMAVMCVAMFALVNGLWTQALCMLFRFAVVQRNQNLKNVTLNPWSTVVVTCLFSAASASMVVLTWQTFYTAEDTQKYLDYWTTHEPGELATFSSTATILCQAIFRNFSTLHIGTTAQYDLIEKGNFVGMIEVCLCEGVGMTLAIATFLTMRRNRHLFSQQTRKMHAQLTWLLVAQFVAPLAFMMAPMAISILLNITAHRPSSFYGDLYILSVSLYGCANATLTLMFVTPYRNKTKEHIRRMLVKIGVRRKIEPGNEMLNNNRLSLSLPPSVRPSRQSVPEN